MEANEIPESYRWANDLKVGDVVFVSSRATLSKSTVTKLTKTQIVVGEHDCRYSRKTLSRRIGSWSSDDLRQATPEREALYQRIQLRGKINTLTREIDTVITHRSNLEKLTDAGLRDLCERLQAIVTEFDPKERDK
jgi:hypothetical protein